MANPRSTFGLSHPASLEAILDRATRSTAQTHERLQRSRDLEHISIGLQRESAEKLKRSRALLLAPDKGPIASA